VPGIARKQKHLITLIDSIENKDNLASEDLVFPFSNSQPITYPLGNDHMSHLGKRKMIYKSALGRDMLVPGRVNHTLYRTNPFVQVACARFQFVPSSSNPFMPLPARYSTDFRRPS